jgi:hypothetical protein
MLHVHPYQQPLVKGKWSRKVLPKLELPQHSVYVVQLNKDIEQQVGSREPVAMVASAHRQEALRGTLYNLP